MRQSLPYIIKGQGFSCRDCHERSQHVVGLVQGVILVPVSAEMKRSAVANPRLLVQDCTQKTS